jgi:hypothetical protein
MSPFVGGILEPSNPSDLSPWALGISNTTLGFPKGESPDRVPFRALRRLYWEPEPQRPLVTYSCYTSNWLKLSKYLYILHILHTSQRKIDMGFLYDTIFCYL